MKTTTHSTLYRLGITLLLAVGASPFAARGQTYNPPGQISYQGFVTDANGVALGLSQPKNYDINFRVYASSSASGALWGEVQTVVVDRGYFSVLLGQGAALSSGEPWTNNLTGYFVGPTASDRFVGITVKGVSSPDSEIQPRLRLLASPYSFLAANANILVNSAGQTLISGASGSPVFNMTNASFYGSPTFNNGLSLSGNVGGSPIFTGSPVFSSNPIFTGAPSFNNGFSVGTGANINGGPNFTGNPTFSGMVMHQNVVYMNDHDLFLHTDSNTGLGWYGSGRSFAGQAPSGPVLYGFNGGALGTVQPTAIALTWDFNNNVVVYNNATINGNASINGSETIHGSLVVDQGDLNIGSLSPGLTFGNGSGEGIASRRSSATDQYSLDFYTGFNRRMSILSNGRVGINTAGPARTLDVNGDIQAVNVYASNAYWDLWGSAYYQIGWSGVNTAVWMSSDKRLKERIDTIPDAVKAIQQLRGVNFHWSETGMKHLTKDIEKHWKSLSGTPEDNQKLWDAKRAEQQKELAKVQTGFLAQEVEQVFPDWVSADPETGYKQINMQQLDAVLVNAVKEQQSQIEAQQQRIATLEERLQALEKLVKAGGNSGGISR